MTDVALTPSQTTGPYLEIGLIGGPISRNLVDEADLGSSEATLLVIQT